MPQVVESNEAVESNVTRILVVDDEANVLSSLTRLLSRRFDILPVKSGKEAIDAALSFDIAMVITDYHMPDINGITLLETLSSIHPNVIKVLISGDHYRLSQLERLNCYKRYLFFTKPWVNDHLRFLVASQLESYGC